MTCELSIIDIFEGGGGSRNANGPLLGPDNWGLKWAILRRDLSQIGPHQARQDFSIFTPFFHRLFTPPCQKLLKNALNYTEIE